MIARCLHQKTSRYGDLLQVRSQSDIVRGTVNLSASSNNQLSGLVAPSGIKSALNYMGLVEV